MKKSIRLILFFSTLLIVSVICIANETGPFFNVKNYGAMGNGETLDSKAINEAIVAASKAGGGTV